MGQRLCAMRAGVSSLLQPKISMIRHKLTSYAVRWAKKEKKERTVPRSNPPGLPTGVSSGS